MARKAKKPKTKPTKQWSPAQLAVQAAGRITGDLRNHLQKVSKAYLLVGQLLTEVRDRKHYVTLHNANMEEYADKRLDLSARSMYRFMKVYEWVRENHKEWLEPGAKVPDLFKIEGLIWVERDLEKEDLTESREAELEAVKKKALKGKLSKKELQAFRQGTGKTDEVIRNLIAATRALRGRYEKAKRQAALESLPLFDQIIRRMENDMVAETAGLGILDRWLPKSDPGGFFSDGSMLA